MGFETNGGLVPSLPIVHREFNVIGMIANSWRDIGVFPETGFYLVKVSAPFSLIRGDSTISSVSSREMGEVTFSVSNTLSDSPHSATIWIGQGDEQKTTSHEFVLKVTDTYNYLRFFASGAIFERGGVSVIKIGGL